MKLSEVKLRVAYRLDPLLKPGVRVIYVKGQFAIREYEYIDTEKKWYVHMSDKTEPLMYDEKGLIAFIDSLKRVDGGYIPKFYDDNNMVPVPEKKQVAKEVVNVQITDAKKITVEASEKPVIANDAATETAKNETEAVSKAFVHIESKKKIYITKDYKLFELKKGNRALNKVKIAKIKKDIETGCNLLADCPIVVVEHGNKLMVIDGQHRLQVCKDLESYVWYVVRSELSLLEIAKMNSNTEKWKNEDYLNCYINTGNQNYMILKKFAGKYKFPLSANLRLLRDGFDMRTSGGNDMECFKSGNFMVKKYDEAVAIAEAVLLFEYFEGHHAREFVIAVSKIMAAKLVPIKDVAAAFMANRDKLKKQGNNKDYVMALEAVYNVGKHKRVVLV